MAGRVSAQRRVAPDTFASQDTFASTVTAVTAAFGDPTRREIYLHLRRNPGATASEVATAFSLHPNVARHHLDRLVGGGYVSVTTERAGTSKGRPSKRYAPVADELSLDPLMRRDDLVTLLLQRALELLGPDKAEAMATEVGQSYGRSLAAQMGPTEGQRSVRAAMETVAVAMTAHGFATHTEHDGAEVTLVSEQCPFGDAAAHHPVLCAVDRGMITGLLEGLGAPRAATPVSLSSRARGDDDCRAVL